jgi:hypothetical protein
MKHYGKWKSTMQMLRLTALALIVTSGLVQYASAGYTPPPCPTPGGCTGSMAALFRDIAVASGNTAPTSGTLTN